MPIGNLSDPREHEKFLEEIRRRAEEAELARIEAEELKLNDHTASEHVGVRQPLHVATTLDLAESPGSARPMVDEMYDSHSNGCESSSACQTVPSTPVVAGERVTNDRAEMASRWDETDDYAFEESQPARLTEAQQDQPSMIRSSPDNCSDSPLYSPESTPDLTSHDFETSPGPGRTRRIAISLLLIAVAATAMYVGYRTIMKTFFPTTGRILVIPDRASTADRYVVEGLTEELIGALSLHRSTEVVAVTSALAMREGDSLRKFAADYAIHLRIDRTGDRFTVHILIKDASGSHGESEDTFVLDELPRFASMALPSIEATLDLDAATFSNAETPDAGAYSSYLLGLHALRNGSTAGLDSAIVLFRNSLSKDPSFARAAVALGGALVTQFASSPNPSPPLLKEAEGNLLLATSLGSKGFELHRLWGYLEYHKGNLANALLHLNRARDLAPSDVQTLLLCALANIRSVKPAEAREAAELAASFDPLNPDARTLYALILMLNEENLLAAEQFEPIPKHHKGGEIPDEYLAALVAANRQERALRILRERATLYPDDYVVQYDLGRMLQLAGKPKQHWEGALRRAEHLIDPLLEHDTTSAKTYAYRGLVATRLGEFGAGTAAGKVALLKAPNDVETKYLVARILALQRNTAREGLLQLAGASRERFSLSKLLELDYQNLRRDSGFLRRVLQ